jgi:hypothetical protein
MCHPRRAPQYTDDFIFWHRVELGLDRFLSSILASTALDALWSSGVEWGFGFSAHVTFRDLVFVEGVPERCSGCVCQRRDTNSKSEAIREHDPESNPCKQTTETVKNSVDPCT